MFTSSRRTEFGSLPVVKTVGAFGDKTKIETVLSFAAWPAASGLRTFQSTVRPIFLTPFPSPNSAKCFLIDASSAVKLNCSKYMH